MKKERLFYLVVTVMLAFALAVCAGCSGNNDAPPTDAAADAAAETAAADGAAPDGDLTEKAEDTAETAAENGQKTDAERKDDGAAKPAVAPAASPAESSAPAAAKPSCTISISCATVLNNMDKVSEAKKQVIPAGGTILSSTRVEFSEGESVFDVLQRVCRDNGIHMEFVNTPMYNSVYIEGINNLYEFDAGSLSGWLYSVNGVFPGYGCSAYTLQDGDVIAWHYTCDLGYDVGGGGVGQK